MPKIALILSALLLASCATKPISTDEAVPVPPDQVMDARYSEANEGTSPVTFKRDKGSLGFYCEARIFVDGVAIAELSQRQKVVLHIPHGEHIFSSKPIGTGCNHAAEVSATIESGHSYAFRTGYTGAGTFILAPTVF